MKHELTLVERLRQNGLYCYTDRAEAADMIEKLQDELAALQAREQQLLNAVTVERDEIVKLCEQWNTTPGGKLAKIIRARGTA